MGCFATNAVQPDPEPESMPRESPAPAPRSGGSPSNAWDLTNKAFVKREKERAEEYFQKLYDTEMEKQDRTKQGEDDARHGKDCWERLAKATAAVAAIAALAAGTAATMDFFGSSFEGADGTRNFLVTWLVLSAAGLVFVGCIKSTAAMCVSCCLATNSINDPGQEIDSIRGPGALDYLGCVDDPQY